MRFGRSDFELIKEASILIVINKSGRNDASPRGRVNAGNLVK